MSTCSYLRAFSNVLSTNRFSEGIETSSDGAPKALHGKELELVRASMSVKRRSTFLKGRLAARQSLLTYFPSPPPVLSSSFGRPLFPGGIRGSISHCDEFSWCVSTQDSRLSGVGIDCQEYDENIDLRALLRAMDSQESIHILSRPAKQQLLEAYFFFSAKEAVFKALQNEKKIKSIFEITLSIESSYHMNIFRLADKSPNLSIFSNQVICYSTLSDSTILSIALSVPTTDGLKAFLRTSTS